MTSKRAQTLCFGLLLSLALTCSAQAQNAKVAFVNIPFILREHPKVQQVNETLRSEFASREAEFNTLRTEFQAEAEKYQRDSAAMGASERAEKERQLQQTEVTLQRQANALNEDLQMRSEELGAQLQRDIAAQIQAYVEDAGYDLVVADAIYVSEDFDITSEVFEAITEE